MSNYKVSLIIPCYNIKQITNDDKSFVNTFNSIKNQTIGFENIELLLINNGSIDSTGELLSNLSKKYQNVKVFSIAENSGGPSIPRNIGIENATSDYLMFLDADDLLNTEMMEKLYNNMLDNDFDIIKIDYNVVIDGQINKKDMGINKSLIVQPKSADLKYVSLYIWDCIFNRKFIVDNDIRFENMRGEDFLFMVECVSKTNNDIFLINDYEGLNYNSDNLSSVSHNCYDLENLEEQLCVSEKCLDLILKGNTFNKEYLEFLSTFLKFSSIIYLFYSNNSNNIKYEMFNRLNNFLNKFGYIKFVKIVELPTTHYLLWKFLNYLIKNNHKTITFLILKFLKKVKSTDRT